MRIMILLLLLAACEASPAWQMTGGTQQEVTLQGWRFTVWRKEDRFEVIRHGYAQRSEQAALPELMLQAVVQATGCKPRVDSGDSGEIRGRLTACPRSKS